jgi:2-polyprenyl-3-methyl-5-hydroxy-6-metoxy-1,4-benzoquinol methylase
VETQMKKQNTLLERRLFDQIAKQGPRIGLPISEYIRIYQDIDLINKDLKPKHSNNRLLEFGCNDGLHSLNLARFGYNTTGFDISSEAIHQARNEANKLKLPIRFCVADANNLSSFDTGSFDVILMFSFLHHFYYSGKMLDILKEADRIISKNGQIVIVEPNHHYYYHFLCFNLAHFLLKIRPFNFLKHTFTLNERSLCPTETVKLIRNNLNWSLEKIVYFDYVKKIICYHGYKGVRLFYSFKRLFDWCVSFLKPSLNSDYFGIVFTKK